MTDTKFSKHRLQLLLELLDRTFFLNIITRVNLTVLLLVAIPLSAFLLILVVEMLRIKNPKSAETSERAKNAARVSDIPAKAEPAQVPLQQKGPASSAPPASLDSEPPKYVFDYQGRLWVEKKKRGFFRQLRRPKLPPEDLN
jgi:hypothetical protein